ncbi:MAG: UDP-N-acetylmuramate dehydrogenase [Candidatus Omnitrophica bacterium]|nr:UDP-N-acetylmuramate dehydrogenase [Candidatus Omnitrophota bacterium]
MMNIEIKEKLRKICEPGGGRVLFDFPLSACNTIGIGGKATAWCAPSNAKALREMRLFLNSVDIPVFVIGNGSNILIPDRGIDAVVIKLSGDFFEQIRMKRCVVRVGAGAHLRKLVSFACVNGLSGLEGLVGIPATIGGALKMNASYVSAISENLSKILILNSHGKFMWVKKNEIDFGYRHSSLKKQDIIVQAEFELKNASIPEIKKKMKEYFLTKLRLQPLGAKTLGCVFKNPLESVYTSGQLIDKAGKKGVQRGYAKISEKHANFIINTGQATSQDVIDLIEKVKQDVKKHFSVSLESEIEVL